MSKRERICQTCEETFDLNVHDYVKDSKGFHHTGCYVNVRVCKGQPMDKINARVTELKEKMKKRESRIKKDANSPKNLFYKYLEETYDVKSIPPYFFIKVNSIVDGTHPNVSESISYEDLLFIFKKRKSYLDKVHTNNIKKGNNLTGIKRVSYDLSIVISMYDSYAKWRDEQATIAAAALREKREAENTIKIDYNNISKRNKNNKSNKESDIESIMSDLFSEV